MSHPTTPEPDEPTPPGVKPNQPKDPSVYGGEWGRGGGQTKTPEPPPDRPDAIETPPAPQGEGTLPTPDTQSSF